jgi:hypothetical protein
MKFRCKRCGADVIVDGTKLGPAVALSAPAMPAVHVKETSGPASSNAPIVRSPYAAGTPAIIERPVAQPAPVSQPKRDSDWALFDEPTQSGREPTIGLVTNPTSWVVDLGADVHETMSTAEICELFARGSLTASTRLRSVGSPDWRPLSSIKNLEDALTARGISLLPRIELSSRGDDDEPREADFAAPTRQLSAAHLWAAAGVKPRAASKAREKDPTREAETARVNRQKLLAKAGVPEKTANPLPSLKSNEDLDDDTATQVSEGAPPASSVPPPPAPENPPVVVEPERSAALAVSDRVWLIRLAAVAGALIFIVGIGSVILIWLYLRFR